MRTEREYLDGLARLHLSVDPDERRGLWRQSMATLAAEAEQYRPVPLEGLDPNDVLASVRTAIAVGLIDDLDFLQSANAAAALYELASVLPTGEERRELGRRVAQRLQQGDAATFVVLATQLANGSRRGLSGAAVRARVALSLDLPIGSGTRADALALALISRQELAEEWLITPSTGSLPSRRLAARLLERAAREAARRCKQGNDVVLAVFERPRVRAAWDRLLTEREPLVWRHVAAARGLLSEAWGPFYEEIVENLDPNLSPTEWRRGAASLAASIAVMPDKSLRQCLTLLESEIQTQDRGVASAMLLGLPRAAEVEPRAAEELCTALVKVGGLDAAEALLSLRHERVGGEFGAWASQMARAQIRESGVGNSTDDGKAALVLALDRELCSEDEPDAEPTLRVHLSLALAAFAETSARAAFERAHGVLAQVERTLRRLESASQQTSEGRRTAFLALRELDGALLESSTLADLLTLGARGDDSLATAPLNGYFARITNWLLRHEGSGGKIDPDHRTLQIHRVRTLLHTVDADGPFGDANALADLKDRRVRTVRLLLTRVQSDTPSFLTRVITASAARACDALLREDIGELSDIFLEVIRHVDRVEDLVTMSEASMVPAMKDLFVAYASLMQRADPEIAASGRRSRANLDALRDVTRAFPVAVSPRVDALHDAMLNFGSAVERVMAARSLHELRGEGESLVANLERATRLLHRLGVGARRRLGDRPGDVMGVAGPALQVVDIALERAYRGAGDDTGESMAAAVGALHEDLPPHLAELAGTALVRAMSLPREADPKGRARDSFRPAPPRESMLPPWLPPSRTLGGFYVLRTLGSGAVGSVFMARRVEEKTNEAAARFALKVPEYSGAAARTLSEQEFLRLFREEAGALLSIPEHENLAHLVTFDAGARPKPILVMELVEGPTLERVLDTGAFDVGQTFMMLDGIAGGLAAMHAVGVGHLDVKPSNVIVRDFEPLMGRSGTPVLVDFGLSGRQVRPGCATASYGAPEIWGLVPKGHHPDPMSADVYAFACLTFESLTGRELVHGSSEVAVITAHLSHDGDLEALRWLAQDSSLAPLATALSGALRQDPRRRTPIAALREQLREVGPTIAQRPWPLSALSAA